MSLITCKVNMILTWSKNYIITDKTTQDVHPYANSSASKIRVPTGATLAITDAKLYVPVVTLPTEDDSKLLAKLKT